MVAPIVVIGVVLGSIYGGISGITEAAGMGVVAVLIISVFRGEASFELVWESLMRTLKSTGTIIWVTIGAAALAGAYTIAGGPQYVADLIVGLDYASHGYFAYDDADLALYGGVYGLGGDSSFDHSSVLADRAALAD